MTGSQILPKSQHSDALLPMQFLLHPLGNFWLLKVSLGYMDISLLAPEEAPSATMSQLGPVQVISLMQISMDPRRQIGPRKAVGIHTALLPLNQVPPGPNPPSSFLASKLAACIAPKCFMAL